MNFRWQSRSGTHGRPRLWILLLVTAIAFAGIAMVLASRPPGEGAANSVPSPSMTHRTTTSPTTTAAAKVSSPASMPAVQPAAPVGEPTTLDYRQLATAAARAIYTWDTRKATYSQTYARIQAWWHVLPDDSNPLTAFAEQFEATGTNAAAYASLTGAHGYRVAKAVNSSCDAQLAEFVRPAPWVGLHVCTVTLAVTEHATSGTNSYTAPVSVVVNCPPATTAPAERCEMVAFYAAPDRIVY